MFTEDIYLPTTEDWCHVWRGNRKDFYHIKLCMLIISSFHINQTKFLFIPFPSRKEEIQYLLHDGILPVIHDSEMFLVVIQTVQGENSTQIEKKN